MSSDLAIYDLGRKTPNKVIPTLDFALIDLSEVSPIFKTPPVRIG